MKRVQEVRSALTQWTQRLVRGARSWWQALITRTRVRYKRLRRWAKRRSIRALRRWRNFRAGWRELRQGVARWWKQRSITERRITQTATGLAMLLLVIAKVDQGGYWSGLSLNLGTELLGGVALYWAFDFIAERNLKAGLIARMGSGVRVVAVAATEELRRYGWLTDGSLRGADLSGANLCGADLRGANLRGVNLLQAKLKKANLSNAYLKDADLFDANLEKAKLIDAHLQKAFLINANLQKANLLGACLKDGHLTSANLEEANLCGANLQGADLQKAILKGANLTGARFDGAVLPDGTDWIPGIDITRFTNQEHPDFWQPHPYRRRSGA